MRFLPWLCPLYCCSKDAMLSISRLVALMTSVSVCNRDRRSNRTALFSFSIRLISLPLSALKSSNASGLGGGELRIEDAFFMKWHWPICIIFLHWHSQFKIMTMTLFSRGLQVHSTCQLLWGCAQFFVALQKHVVGIPVWPYLIHSFDSLDSRTVQPRLYSPLASGSTLIPFCTRGFFIFYEGFHFIGLF